MTMNDNMNKFINYNAHSGQISIKTYRQSQGYAHEDVGGLVEGIAAEQFGCCPLEGAKAALEDGFYWKGSNATQEILEDVHNAICEHEATERDEA
jgi:hypothetical protein